MTLQFKMSCSPAIASCGRCSLTMKHRITFNFLHHFMVENSLPISTQFRNQSSEKIRIASKINALIDSSENRFVVPYFYLSLVVLDLGLGSSNTKRGVRTLGSTKVNKK
jgi:hypothetical protein